MIMMIIVMECQYSTTSGDYGWGQCGGNAGGI